jgi:hypothetical protein
MLKVTLYDVPSVNFHSSIADVDPRAMGLYEDFVSLMFSVRGCSHPLKFIAFLQEWEFSLSCIWEHVAAPWLNLPLKRSHLDW